MIETPLLMTGPMVRALLSGAKTETRRPVNRLKGIGPVTEFQPSDTPGYDWICRDRRILWNDLRHAEAIQRCPYARQVWIRETWRDAAADDLLGSYAGEVDYRYRATSPDDAGPWQPSIFMPRAACRLVLDVGEIRLERVQEITDDAAMREGMGTLTAARLLELGASKQAITREVEAISGTRCRTWDTTQRVFLDLPPSLIFRIGWTLMHGVKSWYANPPVWVLAKLSRVTS